MSEQPVTGRVVFSGPQFTSDKVAAAIRELRDALDAQAERIKELEGALSDLIPVAQETCDRWPNDDCFLIPMKRAREALKDKP